MKKKMEKEKYPLYMMKYRGYVTDLDYINTKYVMQEELFREFEKSEKTNDDYTDDVVEFRTKLNKYDEKWAERFLTERVAVNHIEAVKMARNETNCRSFLIKTKKKDVINRFDIVDGRFESFEEEYYKYYIYTLVVDILDLSYEI